MVDRNLDSVGLYDWLACEPLEQCPVRVMDKLERLGSLRDDRCGDKGYDSDTGDDDDLGTWIQVSHVSGDSYTTRCNCSVEERLLK